VLLLPLEQRGHLLLINGWRLCRSLLLIVRVALLLLLLLAVLQMRICAPLLHLCMHNSWHMQLQAQGKPWFLLQQWRTAGH
jgi:hypothetical protein